MIKYGLKECVLSVWTSAQVPRALRRQVRHRHLGLYVHPRLQRPLLLLSVVVTALQMPLQNLAWIPVSNES